MEIISAPHSQAAPSQGGATAQIPSPALQPEPMTLLHIGDRAALAAAWRGPRPLLTHLNADTTWVLHLPYPEGTTPPPGRSRFNVLLDPWLQGPQSDGGRWFSIQWHVVAPGVRTLRELDALLGDLEAGVAREMATEEEEEEEEDQGVVVAGTGTETETETETRNQKQKQEGLAAGTVDSTYIDVVAVSHEFTDHCHEATLRELPRAVPVFAPSKAAKLIRSWKHFDVVVETPAFSATSQKHATGQEDWRAALLLGKTTSSLPPWLGVGRLVTPGNALYYHSALIVAWENTLVDEGSSSGSGSGSGQAIVYSPHGIEASALEGLGREQGSTTGLRVLALLHGLDDVRLWMTKQLNLGAVNGVAAARACGAKYWVATHDEVKKGGGFVSLLLRRTRWSVADAVERDGEQGREKGREGEGVAGYEFVEMGSGDALVLV